ncbi:hypothetical protein ACET3Z_007746 [Daucus carota]
MQGLGLEKGMCCSGFYDKNGSLSNCKFLRSRSAQPRRSTTTVNPCSSLLILDYRSFSRQYGVALRAKLREILFMLS